MNYLVEDGEEISVTGNICQNGINIILLDKVLLEAEMLELKANPDKPAIGTVIESSSIKEGLYSNRTCKSRHFTGRRYNAC